MPGEEQLRTIANAPLDDQAQVWKAHKPKKGHDVSWWEVARAAEQAAHSVLGRQVRCRPGRGIRRDLVGGLFAPAGEDSRYTTNADGFFGAQQAWMTANLPANGSVLPQDEYGRPELPKDAERIFGKPTKQDKIGHYLDSRSGEVQTIAYRLPEPKKPAKGGKGGTPEAVADARAGGGGQAPAGRDPEGSRHGRRLPHRRAARGAERRDDRAGHAHRPAGAGTGRPERHRARARSTTGGPAARRSGTGSARVGCSPPIPRCCIRQHGTCSSSCCHAGANMTDSGISSRIAGETLGAATYLPTMATEEFLSCLSRQALERSAAAEGVKVEVRVKDTRASLVKHWRGQYLALPGRPLPVDRYGTGQRCHPDPLGQWHRREMSSLPTPVTSRDRVKLEKTRSSNTIRMTCPTSASPTPSPPNRHDPTPVRSSGPGLRSTHS